MIEIHRIDAAHAEDLRLKNDPFPLNGRMIPSLQDGQWQYRIERWESAQTQTFPEDDYDFETLCRDGAAFGAYEDGICVGIVVCRQGFFRYDYLENLKVSQTARRKGVGRDLVRACLAYAAERGQQGLYLQAQDNNLSACLFYLKCGFTIGGFDNRVYEGTSQAGKADIIFYAKA